MDKDQHLSILIIEDNPGDQLLLYEDLISTSLLIADIIIAETLAKGIGYLHKQNFSLIFLDLFLPDSTGLDSFSALIKINSRIPVVIYSGLSDTQIALKAITSGAQDFLIKGDYTVSLLEKTIRYSIERKNNSDALEESNARYNFLSKATHDMVWDWDLVTDKVHRNIEGWEKLFKATEFKEDGTSENWTSRVYPDDLKKMEQVIDELIKSDTQQLFEIEFRIVRDDNTIGYIRDRGYIIRNEKGNAIRVIGASHDITERKNAEEKVLLSEQRFKSLVQNSSDIIAILDAEGNYKYVSPTSKKILGYDPDFFIGKSTFSFIHPDDLQNTLGCLAAMATEKSVKVPLFRLKHISGEWLWIESTITNLIDDPAVGGIVVNSKDVTAKKIADDELTKLSLVAKETINGVVIRDKDQNIVWVNNAFTKMYGYELNEVTGKSPQQFLHGPETDIEVVGYVQEQLMKNEPFVYEIINYTKPGNKIYVRIQMQPIFDENGDFKQSFALLTDITRQKELEEKVELEKIIKQKEITDAVIAAQESERSEIGRELHDNVNQLLSTIHLYIGMARKDGESRDSLLTNASAFTLSAIEEIRKLSKTLITPLIKEIGVKDSIKDLAEEIMLVHPIQIVFTAKEFMEDELNDKFKLNIFRIVQEQISNILKHAQAKKININMEERDSKLLISITDDGIGFDITKRKAGIGIANIRSRSELYNGTVLLTSEPGKGTVLSITFNKTGVLLNNHNQPGSS